MLEQNYQPDEEEKVVKLYYDELAPDYDRLRFDNSYGRYIDAQEREILSRWLGGSHYQSVLDVACGTGRFLSFATVGLDLSAKMIEIAKAKYPDKEFIRASASDIPVESGQFDAVFTLHLFMHLNPAKIQAIMNECHRVLRPHGVLIFDIPSALRRSIVSYQSGSWHGGTSLSFEEIHQMCKGKWQMEELIGVNFLPIHRFPQKARPLVLPIDKFLCHSFLKFLSSYYFARLIKI